MLYRRGSAAKSDDFVEYGKCPAKTFLSADGNYIPGRSVLSHCQIVGEVARELVARFPDKLRGSLFPEGAPLVAAGHDIGKVSPTFYNKIMHACKLPTLSGFNPALERQWGGHAGVSQVAVKAVGVPEYVPEILGQHHGFSPNVVGRRSGDEIFGGSAWQVQREELVAALKDLLGCDWPCVGSPAQARLLAGLTSVADWIGSGEHFEDPAQPWRGKIGNALDMAGFVPPAYRQGLGFQDVFSFAPRPAQTQLIEVATKPGVYVLEAPMGLGKTEAALYVAYRMLAQGWASGIYFALPTQLTSNKIYDRFNNFLASILADDYRHRSLLLHGAAWLQDTEMGEEGRPGGSWFNQAKRGLLAPFAVGTIDQALMAAMNVKHGFVRAYGLAGKVVILDEVHTYDAYTGTILDALVALLRSLHCTVIILSATLNQERRRQLLGAEGASQAYPLITASTEEGALIERPVAAEAEIQVKVRLLQDEKPVIQEALDRAARGQQVLWIENTVGDAQSRYLDLAARAVELGLECGLLHSRFSVDDRSRIENYWVDLFGKHGWSRRNVRGRILIGTQVLEQSLDIDADFLVSRFAPSDMLLQRCGRLWRHGGTPRASGAECEAWLLVPDLAAAIEAPYTAFSNSAHVYSPYVLCRSLEAWQQCTRLSLPRDIRSLIEQTYAIRQEEGGMARWLQELENGTPRRKGRLALRQLARITLAEGGKTLPESQAQTRYSESDSYELLLLRGLSHLPDEKASLLTLLDGRQLVLPWQRHRLGKPQWRQLTATLMRQIVPVRVGDAPLSLPRDTLEKFGLHHCFYLGDPNWVDDESLLRVALVDETGAVQGVQGARVHEKYSLDYRDDLGYRVIKD